MRLILEKGATSQLRNVLRDYQAKRVFVLADKNTERVAGEKVYAILDEMHIPYKKCVFQEDRLAPNETAVGRAMMAYDTSSDLVLTIGSGVLNDVGKIVANVAQKPYVILATAPSMDGYASSTSSMEVEGLKTSLPSKCADVIIGDIDILKNAPMETLQSGLGDMLAKYISIAEWRIAHEILGEYYCEEIAKQVRDALRKCIDSVDLLLKRDEDAVKAVFEGLVFCGQAMALAGGSRPASGVEHYFSHIWDMRGLEFSLPTNLHGIQCAVATYVVAGLYEKVLTLVPNPQKAYNYVEKFSYTQWAKDLQSFLGNGANAMIALEAKEEKYSVEKHKIRFNRIVEKWEQICAIIREEIPMQQEIGRILQTIGLPNSVQEIGIACDLQTTLNATKDIRDKYVLSRLLWDLGELENFI
jgi:glycerol-1-phosphate dehydrogenase [NAD(P)+]